MVTKEVHFWQVKQYQVPIWLQLIYFLHRNFIRSCFRWFMEKATGWTLLERVLLKNTKHLACITLELERLIEEYDLPQLYNGWTEDNEEELVKVVLYTHCLEREKEVYDDLKRILERSMKQIREYKELCEKVEKRRKEKFDANNVHHEKKLQKLWKALVPDEVLVSRRSKQWQLIGFQGDDPGTDFRGMGVLALDQLAFFARYDVDNARTVLKMSMDVKLGFPMAITGVTITSALCRFLHNGDLKNHFYNSVSGSLKMDDFHHAYCIIFKLFSEIWAVSNPTSIMAFNSIFDNFCERLLNFLNKSSANLNVVDEIFNV